jgi:hypothetical protein
MVFAYIPTISPSIQKLDVPLLMKLGQPKEVSAGLKSPRSLPRTVPSTAIQTKYTVRCLRKWGMGGEKDDYPSMLLFVMRWIPYLHVWPELLSSLYLIFTWGSILLMNKYVRFTWFHCLRTVIADLCAYLGINQIILGQNVFCVHSCAHRVVLSSILFRSMDGTPKKTIG